MKTKAKKTVKRRAAGKPLGNPEPFRKKLEELRADLIKIVQKKKAEVIPEEVVGDEGDVAVRSLERDLVFEQTGTERRLLEEVEAALRRIEKGTYGVCEANGERISAVRLKVMPYARYCINCQSRFETA